MSDNSFGKWTEEVNWSEKKKLCLCICLKKELPAALMLIKCVSQHLESLCMCVFQVFVTLHKHCNPVYETFFEYKLLRKLFTELHSFTFYCLMFLSALVTAHIQYISFSDCLCIAISPFIVLVLFLLSVPISFFSP